MKFLARLFGGTSNDVEPQTVITNTPKPLIDSNTLREILTRCKDPVSWSRALSEVLSTYNITSKEALASFIAQCGHESAHFNVLEENLNYSADALMRVWPRHFPTKEIANQYARKPEMIASRAYANRMGNGSEESGEGWKYRGRGLIMVTGKDNYRRCSQFLFNDNRLLSEPELILTTNRNAVESACWFWVTNNLNNFVTDTERTTRIINGGLHGLADRRNLYNKAIRVLS